MILQKIKADAEAYLGSKPSYLKLLSRIPAYLMMLKDDQDAGGNSRIRNV